MRTKVYAAAVAKGVALLDKAKPNWWNGKKRPTINLVTLNLSSTCNCVLGQVYRPPSGSFTTGYDVGKDKLNIAVGALYGFDIPDDCSRDYTPGRQKRRLRQYGVLRQRWLEVVRGRRRAAARKAARGG